MASLYEMTKEIEALYDALQDTELEDSLRDTIIENHIEGMGASEKVEGCCQVIKQFNFDVNMYAEEIKRLQARKKTAENSIKRIKNNLLEFLKTSGNEKFKAGTFSISTSTSKSVNVFSIGLLPPEYIIPTEPKIDKKAIGEALKNGAEVPGAEFEYKEGVNIR